MKIIQTLVLLLFSISLAAQQSLDTIFANDQKNVALFFPNPIRQSITGASHFVFTYNREKEQYFGLLQAKPGTESNLLAVTSNGSVYSYILKYSDNLPQLNYFINENERIGHERPTIQPIELEKNSSSTHNSQIAYFQRACNYLLKSKYKPIVTERKKGLKLQLQKMVYDGDEVYLVIEVQNKSGINFEIDYLEVYRTNGNKKRKASFQLLDQEVIYAHQMPTTILNNLSQRFAYVIPKFVLGDNEKLMLELKELKGSRKVVLESRL